MVIISSPAAIKDILDVRGTVTGGRPRTHLQRATRGLHLVLESLENPVWKRSRKAVTRFLTEENLSVYMATQKVEYVQMLNDVLTRPDVGQNPDRFVPFLLIGRLGDLQPYSTHFSIDHDDPRLWQEMSYVQRLDH